MVRLPRPNVTLRNTSAASAKVIGMSALMACELPLRWVTASGTEALSVACALSVVLAADSAEPSITYMPALAAVACTRRTPSGTVVAAAAAAITFNVHHSRRWEHRGDNPGRCCSILFSPVTLRTNRRD